MGEYIICRLVYEFAPRTGGSITHIIETANNINPYLKKQIIIAPRCYDKEYQSDCYKFQVIRVSYLRLKWLESLKKNLFKGIPLAPIVRFSYGCSAFHHIKKINKNYQLDIIHSHGIHMGVVASIVGKVLKIPVVWMLDGTLEAYSEKSSFFETIMLKIFRPKYLNVADDGSPGVAKFRKVLGNKSVTVVNHSIDHHKFCPLPPDTGLLKCLNIDQDNFIILSPHSLIPVKGVDAAILAYQKFIELSKCNKCTLIIAGDGILRSSLEELTNKLGLSDFVRFVGYVDNSNMVRFFSISDIVIGTSTYSNLNLSIQEAMACGKPVVVFDSGGTKKVVTHEETGLLVEPHDIHQLSNGILKLYMNPDLRLKMGTNARNFIVESRSWENRVKIELSVYEHAINNI